MAQLFHPRSNVMARTGIVAGLAVLGLTGWSAHQVLWSPLATRQRVEINQPVPFSHEHHVSGLGIDCRYCHASVETSAFAGIPPTETCMTCHSQIWTEAPMLAPVRESYAQGQPIRWNRVHDLPDFAYFNHSIHIAKGVGCSTCHGRVDLMPLTQSTVSLYMKWCLDCHRDPEPNLRPPSQIYNFQWESSSRPPSQASLSPNQEARLTDCSICHR